MGTESLAAHTVAYNLVPIMFMVPLGMSIGANVRVGTLLAAGHPVRARQVAVGTVLAFCVVGVVLCSIAYACGDAWGSLFTDDESVLAQVGAIWGLVCLDVWIDSLFGVQSGVMRGIGMQMESSYGVLLCLWVVGVPAVRVVCFGYNTGLVGLWSVMPCLYALLNVALAFLWLRRDFAGMSREIREKAEKEGGAMGCSELGDADGNEKVAYAQVHAGVASEVDAEGEVAVGLAHV